MQFDTLLLLGEQNQYTHIIASGRTITLNDTFSLASNGCFPSTLKASSTTAATINMLGTSNVETDFINLENIIITGSGTYNAGANSNDNGGNTGWVFEGETYTTSQLVTYPCIVGADLWLVPENHEFSRSFSWSTGATTDSILVTSSGTYYMNGNYGTNCTQTDTFYVELAAFAEDGDHSFLETRDTIWNYCQNWPSSEIPDSLTDVIINNTRRAYVGAGDTANADNLTISAGGTLIIDGGVLNIYGDFINNGNLINTGGSIVLNGADVQTLAGTTTTDFHDLHIQKNSISDTVYIGSTININNSMVFGAGVVKSDTTSFVHFLAGSTTTGESNNSYIEGPVHKTGSEDFIFPSGHNGRLGKMGISDLVSSSTFTAEYKVGTSFSDSTNGTLNNVSIPEIWFLNRVGGVSGAKTTLYWQDNVWSGIASTAPADLVVAHYDEANEYWESYGQEATSGLVASGWVTSTYQTSFSPFRFGSPTGVNPLPIELLSFTVNKESDVATLNWRTATEVNNNHFVVYSSENGEEYTYLNKVNSKASNGNSSTALDYTLKDDLSKYSASSEVVYYKLEQVDLDGTLNNVGIRAISLANNAQEFEASVYPNPFSDIFNLSVNGVVTDNAIFILTDVNGKEVYRKKLLSNSSEIDLSGFAPGSYNGRVITQEGTISNMKLLKQ